MHITEDDGEQGRNEEKKISSKANYMAIYWSGEMGKPEDRVSH
jgi:hypothetical protein